MLAKSTSESNQQRYCLMDSVQNSGNQKKGYKRAEGCQCSLPASMATSITDDVSLQVQVRLVTRRSEQQRKQRSVVKA
jgi:hypothetical protein